MYAASGTFSLDVDNKRWLLPPQRAALVAADTQIRIQATAPITSSSILFARDSIPAPADSCRVFAVTPLAREMIVYAMRWGLDRDPSDAAADQFFGAIAGVCVELAAHPEAFWLPRAHSDELGRAIEHVLGHVGSRLWVSDIAEAVNVSERTLARRFVEETLLTCGEFVRRVRMLRAMELLAERDAPIGGVASAVGFASISAFTTGFRRFTRQTPRQYARRQRAS